MKYLQEDTYDEAHCMKCRNPWSDAFVKDTCTKVFWNGPFKEHKDRLFMDHQRNLLPVTQEWMAYDQFKTIVKRKREEVKRDMDKIQQDFATRLREALVPLRRKYEQFVQVDQVLDEDMAANEVPSLILDMEGATMRRKDGRPIQGLVAQLETKEEERKNPVSALSGTQCPKESCRGFINDRGQCGTCTLFVCAKCRQSKKAYVDEDHVCKEEDIQSVNFLRKDSKPCPSCSAPIHKIAGCSHMWCTACHTAFCWNTLKILNPSQAHNPHMVQWLIANGGNGRQGGGGRAPTGPHAPVYQAIRDKMAKAPKILAFLPQLFALHNHFQFLIQGLQAPYRSSRRLRDLRLSYLRGYSNTSQWKSAALAWQKKADRVKVKVQLLETFMLGADGLVRCDLATKTPKELNDEAHRLREFFNEAWATAFRAGDVGSVKRSISKEFYWHRENCPCDGKRACTTCSRQNI